MEKKQTAMQDLRDDLVDSVESSLKALEEIEDGIVRQACQMVVKKTLEAIIKRVDEELLEMEKEQIKEAYREGRSDQQSPRDVWFYHRNAESYYNETYGGTQC